MTEIEAGTVFRTADDGEIGVDVATVFLQMEASQTPIVVRRDRTETWWVIIQGPPGMLHCHVIDPVTSALEGFRTPWHAALAVAESHARNLRQPPPFILRLEEFLRGQGWSL